MKKIMVLTGILCTYMGTMAATSAPITGITPQAAVVVTADVVTPLTLETKDVVFGNVSQGTNGNVPKTNGEIKITGENNSKIKVQFKDHNNNTFQDYSVWNKEVSLKNGNETLTYMVVINSNNISTEIGSTGTDKMVVNGTLNVPKGKKKGHYEGSFDVKVNYE